MWGGKCVQVTFSALIMACVDNEQLDRASEVYQLTVKAGVCPDVHAYNALINAYGCGSQVTLQDPGARLQVTLQCCTARQVCKAVP